MSDLSMQLPERLSRLGETGLLIPLLRLLADGDPVTVQQLSVAAGRTIDEVRLGLAAMQDTEYDDPVGGVAVDGSGQRSQRRARVVMNQHGNVRPDTSGSG